jgi:hypothetical protein
MRECRYSSTMLDLCTRGEWAASHLDRFAPGKLPYWPWGWVGPSAGLDVVEERKIMALPSIESQASSP